MDHGIRNEFQRAGVIQLVPVVRGCTQGHCCRGNTYNYGMLPSNRREICLRNCQRTGSDRWEDRRGFAYCIEVRRQGRLTGQDTSYRISLLTGQAMMLSVAEKRAAAPGPLAV
jgi:hypothetical protein